MKRILAFARLWILPCALISCAQAPARLPASETDVQEIPAEGERLLLEYRKAPSAELLSNARAIGNQLLATRESCRAWSKETRDGKKSCTLDNDLSQSILRFLMDLDQAEGNKDAALEAAVRDSLNAILESQYSSGAFAQFVGIPPEIRQAEQSARRPARARFPKGYPKPYVQYHRPELPIAYNYNYTLNDGTLTQTIRLLLQAGRQYGDTRYRKAALRAADFLVTAQLPAPQAGWSQQYNFALEPEWGRAHEPPSLATRETHDVIELLLQINGETGSAKYCKPLLPAIAWLRSALFRQGDAPLWQGPRFYELVSNKPMYLDHRDEQGNGSYVDSRDQLRAEVVDKAVNKFETDLEALEKLVRARCHSAMTSTKAPSSSMPLGASRDGSSTGEKPPLSH